MSFAIFAEMSLEDVGEYYDKFKIAIILATIILVIYFKKYKRLKFESFILVFMSLDKNFLKHLSMKTFLKTHKYLNLSNISYSFLFFTLFCGMQILGFDS